MNRENIDLFFIFSAFVGAPFIAPVVSWIVSRKPKQIQCNLYITFAGVIALVVAAMMLGISTRYYSANFFAFSLAFVLFGIIAVSCFRIRPKLVGILLGSIFSLPIVGGLYLGTVGRIFLIYLVLYDVPIHTQSNKEGFSCYVTSFGDATTSEGGYNVELKKSLPVITFLEHKVKIEHLINPVVSAKELCKNFLQGALVRSL